jgi:hypothetical protein
MTAAPAVVWAVGVGIGVGNVKGWLLAGEEVVDVSDVVVDVVVVVVGGASRKATSALSRPGWEREYSPDIRFDGAMVPDMLLVVELAPVMTERSKSYSSSSINRPGVCSPMSIVVESQLDSDSEDSAELLMSRVMVGAF